MATDTTLDAFFESGAATAQPDLLVSATLHLMSQYTTQGGCVKLASVIERHLKVLAGLPDLAPVLSATCSLLSEQWAAVVERNMPHGQKGGRIGKWMSGTRLA